MSRSSHSSTHSSAHSQVDNVPAGPRFPLEFPCFGPSPDAVRAVASDLVRALEALRPDLRIGWVTDPSCGAGATAPFNPASPGRVVLSAPAWNADSWRAALADCDLAVTEGRPKPGFPGILVLPSLPNPADAGSVGSLSSLSGLTGLSGLPPGSLLACVAPQGESREPSGASALPIFPPHRLDGLARLILARAAEILAAVPLFGLVLGGGRSTRMRADKASLRYHGKPQTEHCLDLLAPHCAQRFVSCRADQADQPGFAGLPLLPDTFLDMGPLGGILSALKAHRHAAFLVVACDLPFLDNAGLDALARGRDPFKIATAFAGPQDGLPEPLCAIYEPRCYPRALQLLGQGISCPRKVILNSSSRMLTPTDPRFLHNANDPEAFRAASAALGK
jgi:molybdopterin-guanine dinucleotide biosynthesis protein A